MVTSWKKLIKKNSNCSAVNFNEIWLMDLKLWYGLFERNTYIIFDNQVQFFSPWQQVLKSLAQKGPQNQTGWIPRHAVPG